MSLMHVTGSAKTGHFTSVTMKTTKVQTLGAVALYATAACTDDASIVGFGPLHLILIRR